MSLIDRTPRWASCITLSETTVLEVTEALFDRLVEESPAVAYAILRRILELARSIDRDAVNELTAKNQALQKAYAELQAAQADLVEKERLEVELELAATVQRSLLPARLPQYPGYCFDAYLEPARLVGGDFYDVLELDEEHVGLLMADVADKGFHAALFMAMARTLFAQEARHSLSPSQVAVAVHRGALQIAAEAELFVTAFYGVLHRPSGRLVYVRAGHDQPLLFRPGQCSSPLPGKGRFLGMWEELELNEYRLQMQPGDRLLLFSDGVPDAMNSEGEQYGNARLRLALDKGGALGAAELVAHIAADVAGWCQDAPPFDDLTLLALEVNRSDLGPLPVAS
jgi:serine phosphatase RsbU (regulator of sigma subunit)